MRDRDILFKGNILILFANLFMKQYLVETDGYWLAFLVPAIIFIEGAIVLYREYKMEDKKDEYVN